MHRSLLVSLATVCAALSGAEAALPEQSLHPRSLVSSKSSEHSHSSRLHQRLKTQTCEEAHGYCFASCASGAGEELAAVTSCGEGKVCCKKACTVASKVINLENGFCQDTCGEGHIFQTTKAGADGCDKVKSSSVKCCATKALSTSDADVYDALKTAVEALKQPASTTAASKDGTGFNKLCTPHDDLKMMDTTPASGSEDWTDAKWFDKANVKNIIGVRRWHYTSPANKFYDEMVLAYVDGEGTKHIERAFMTAYAGAWEAGADDGMARLKTGQWHMIEGKHKGKYAAFRQYRQVCVDRIKDWKDKLDSGDCASEMKVNTEPCGCYGIHVHSTTSPFTRPVKNWSVGCQVVPNGVTSGNSVKANSFYKKVLDAGKKQGDDDTLGIVRYNLINANDLSDDVKMRLFDGENDAQ